MQFDFSQEHGLGGEKVARRAAVVRNDAAQAVLHVGITSPVAWLDVFPAEFALAAGEAQMLTAELHPGRARNAALSPVQVSLFGQYIAVQAVEADALPADLSLQIAVVPPLSNCPHCAADLPEGARECRRCGERIRLCPICGTPNTWIARACRLNPGHVLRAEADWQAAPGGDATHSLAPTAPLGTHLARRWSFPSFPPTRAADLIEWSAPLAAFGMVIASGIEAEAGRATIQAWELATGAALWDFDLPDPKGLYPDRGAMALSDAGTLYAATLGGQIIALDAVRGTRRWAASLKGPIYGGLAIADDLLLVPDNSRLRALDRENGTEKWSVALGGRLDTAPGASDGLAYVTCDDGLVSAFALQTGAEQWRAQTDGAYDAAPLIKNGTVYTATMAGTVYALDAQTGKTRWKTSVTSRPIAAAPALSVDGLLFVPADDGYLHIVAARTGNLIRSRRVSAAPLRSSPVCSGQTVFVGADDGNVYALDADYAVQRAYETTPGARLTTAGLALYGDTLVCAASNGVLYVLRATP